MIANTSNGLVYEGNQVGTMRASEILEVLQLRILSPFLKDSCQSKMVCYHENHPPFLSPRFWSHDGHVLRKYLSGSAGAASTKARLICRVVTPVPVVARSAPKITHCDLMSHMSGLMKGLPRNVVL